jgi:hypothetical protein
VVVEISGTLLLDSSVIDDPHPFYRQLQNVAPVWEIPDTGLSPLRMARVIAM